jgi:hypothetical protein
MTGTSEGALARHEADERFNLLVADVREYAVFLVTPQGIILSKAVVVAFAARRSRK